VAATVALVEEKGWQQVTTRQIAARAGVNQALVHYHFGSVDALLRQAVTSELEGQMAEPVARLLESQTPAEGVRALTDWLAAIDANSRLAILSAEIMARATRDQQLREWLAGWLVEVREQLRRSIEAAQATGSVRLDIAAERVAVVVAALIDGLIFHGLVDPQLDLPDVAVTLDALLSAGPNKEGS
jgi:AcrR family transcriptional regulator